MRISVCVYSAAIALRLTLMRCQQQVLHKSAAEAPSNRRNEMDCNSRQRQRQQEAEALVCFIDASVCLSLSVSGSLAR